MPMLVKGEYDDPRIPVVLDMPVSDNKLQIAANVYARQTSLLCCINCNHKASVQASYAKDINVNLLNEFCVHKLYSCVHVYLYINNSHTRACMQLCPEKCTGSTTLFIMN